MNKLSLNKLSLKKPSKEGGASFKLPKGIKIHQLVLGAAIVVLLALTIYFAYSYYQGVDKKDKLVSDIAKKERDIAANPLKNISELQAKLGDAAANLSANARFPKSVDDTELATQLIEISKDANTPYFKFLPASGSTITINKNAYSVKSYDISFGSATTVPKIIYFLKNLEELQYPTSRITGIQTGQSGDLWTLSLKFDVILRNQ